MSLLSTFCAPHRTDRLIPADYSPSWRYRDEDDIVKKTSQLDFFTTTKECIQAIRRLATGPIAGEPKSYRYGSKVDTKFEWVPFALFDRSLVRWEEEVRRKPELALTTGAFSYRSALMS